MRALYILPLLALAAAACGGPPDAQAPKKAHDPLAPLVGAAFREEANGDAAKAGGLWLRALEVAASAPEDAASLPAIQAALDALVYRDVGAFDVAQSSALVDRLPGRPLDDRLARIAIAAEGPFAAGLVARARMALAEREGDAGVAGSLREASGCVREATLFGPTAWSPVSGARQTDALDANTAALPGELAGPGPFAKKIPALRIVGFGCNLPLYASSTASGVRDLVVDVDVPRAGTVGLAMWSSTAAVLRAGGQVAIDRSHDAGAGEIARFATVDAGKGTMRLVVHAGMAHDYTTIELAAWDANGKPLRTHAPVAGAVAGATGRSAVSMAGPPAKTDDERLAFALGALAAGDDRAAEGELHVDVARQDAPPELLITYARAMSKSRDLPAVKSNERARAALDRALEKWPSAWEAVLEHAVLAGARVAAAESALETLSDLDKSSAKAAASSPALVAAFDALVAARANLRDRASASLARAKDLGGSRLLRDVDRNVSFRTGKERTDFECATTPDRNATSIACHASRMAAGDRPGAEQELDRLRALTGAPQLYLSISTKNALETGDTARAAALWGAMNPADRTVSTLYGAKGKSALAEIFRASTVSRDSPAVLSGVLRDADAGEDPLKRFDGVAERVTADNGGGSIIANAATAVLAHEELYDVEDNGLVHFVMLDVRRMMGTADVEANAQAGAPNLAGRDTFRVLRRRIFKKDGRILLPDPTPHAQQLHADLSQLEAGDAVEAIYEGWTTPEEMGNVGFDTPDLLPERTAVRDAKVELHLPAGLAGSLWSHPMLGKPEESTKNGKRVLVFRLKDHGVRRIEYGVPKMDRNVAVSFATTTWDDVAKGLKETLASLDAASPEVSAWAHEAAKGARPSKALVENVLVASGQAVKEASGTLLADVDLGRGADSITARTILATQEGSRTWLVVRALRELGVACDVVVAENDPFSDSPTFPPHFGRFMHPLAVAHVPEGDVWIDADVSGPPLPAGRVSPELRGRMALFQDGHIGPLPKVESGDVRDEVDERLTVDDKGDAKGVLTVILRGRAAQDLSEALVRLVGLERQRALRGIALAWVPFATVEKVELSSTEGSWQIAIRADFTAPAYAQIEGEKKGIAWVLPGIDPVHYVYPRPYSTTLVASYASQGARENALAISHASQYHVRRRVELPPKADVARLPGPFDATGPLFAAKRKISVDGKTIEEDFTLDVVTGTVPKDKYDAFVTAIHAADDAFRASTRVKPPAMSIR